MIYTSHTIRLVNHCFTTRTSHTSRGLVYTPSFSLMIYTSPTVRPVNHFFTTGTTRTGTNPVRIERVVYKRICHYTGRISPCILDNLLVITKTISHYFSQFIYNYSLVIKEPVVLEKCIIMATLSVYMKYQFKLYPFVSLYSTILYCQ